MKITPLALSGVFLLEREPFVDERGSFARQFCLKELAQQGLDFTLFANAIYPATPVNIRCAGCITKKHLTRKEKSFLVLAGEC